MCRQTRSRRALTGPAGPASLRLSASRDQPSLTLGEESLPASEPLPVLADAAPENPLTCFFAHVCKTHHPPLGSLSSDGGGSRPDLMSAGTDAHAPRSAPCAARTFLCASISSSREGHRLRSTRRGSALSPSATVRMAEVSVSNSL